MAINISISAQKFPPINTIGQTSGFQPFTAAELASNNFISTIKYVFEYESEIAFSGTTINETIGKEIVVNTTKDEVEAYLLTIFSDSSKTYDANVFILNVLRKSNPISGVPAASQNSVFVSRFDIFSVSVQIDVKVTP